MTEKETLQPVQNPPSLGVVGALKTAAKEVWERLGLIIGMSATWWLFLTIGFSVWQPLHGVGNPIVQSGLTALLATFLAAPTTAGIFVAASQALAKEPVSYSNFWRGGRKIAGMAIRLALLHLLVIGLLVLNIWFYMHVSGVVGIMAMFLSVDALILWGLMGIYHFPLLVAQEAGLFDTPENPVRRGLWPVLRRAFFLALGRPLHSAGIFFAALVLTILLFPAAPLMLLLWPGALAMLLTAGTRNLLLQFEVLVLHPSQPVSSDEIFRN